MQVLNFSTENMSAKVLHRPLWPITPRCTAAMPLPTRWGGAPDPVIHGRHKPYKMAENKWATGIITLLLGVITPLIKGRRGLHRQDRNVDPKPVKAETRFPGKVLPL